MLSESLLDDIINKRILVAELSDDELANFCLLANQKYRLGDPIVPDEDYDFIYRNALKERLPHHPLLIKVEGEGVGFSESKILLPKPMLSIDKAYLWAEVLKWFERIEKSALALHYQVLDILIEVTPKLDGFAGFDDGVHLYTRGDGLRGSDISRAFVRGLSIFKDGVRGLGAGEIVVKKSYFAKYLAKHFEHARNFQASIIKEKALDKLVKKAILDKAAVFVPFSLLPNWRGSIAKLKEDFSFIVEEILSTLDFNMDGVVLSVVNEEIKTHMGSNRKFHRWQIAFKENKEKAQVKVLDVLVQVGRTGRITPVLKLEPIFLSGATLSRASAYHYGYIRAQKLGCASIIELTRSGLVIPKVVRVLRPSKAQIPTHCPSCAELLIWSADFLICSNHSHCPAQCILRLKFFFKTLDNNDGFGHATIKRLYEGGIRLLSEIYKLDVVALLHLGFGTKTTHNLLAELKKSRLSVIPDWRFLAAFGVDHLGLGNSERLLKYYKLDDIFNLEVDDITKIDGFVKRTAENIISGLANIKTEFKKLMFTDDAFQSFNLIKSIEEQANNNHPLSGKTLVFSGKMRSKRTQMIKEAKAFGIHVKTSISSHIDYLVLGEALGQTKLAKAKKYGIHLLTEKQYLAKLHASN